MTQATVSKKIVKMIDYRSHIHGVPELNAIETDGKDLGLKPSSPFSP